MSQTTQLQFSDQELNELSQKLAALIRRGGSVGSLDSEDQLLALLNDAPKGTLRWRSVAPSVIGGSSGGSALAVHANDDYGVSTSNTPAQNTTALINMRDALVAAGVHADIYFDPNTEGTPYQYDNNRWLFGLLDYTIHADGVFFNARIAAARAVMSAHSIIETFSTTPEM